MIVKYKFEIERRHRGRKVITEKAPRPPRPSCTKPRPSTKARRLALAYFIERAIDAGLIQDYADAARRLGLTRARLTQIVDLTVMTVADQEAMLNGRAAAAEPPTPTIP